MDLETRCGGVCKSATAYLISMFCSCSALNGLSSKTSFKIIIKKHSPFVQNLLMCFITKTTLS